MKYILSLNTGFAVNRFTDFEDLATTISNKFKINNLQFTADLLNPSLPDKIYFKEAENILKIFKSHNILIDSTFTGAFTRLNHLAHTNTDIQEYWISWFKKFVDFTSIVGAESMGSHLGILSYKENNNLTLKKNRLQTLISNWHKVAEYAEKKGLKFISWEPMSISREFGETIQECKLIQKSLNKNSPLEFKICYDVDHGDLMSKNSDDINPYKWLEEFSSDICYIHLKQSTKNKGGHWPFIDKYNKVGKIKPKEIIRKLEELSINVPLILELSFKEREPNDSLVIDHVSESINYWKNFI